MSDHYNKEENLLINKSNYILPNVVKSRIDIDESSSQTTKSSNSNNANNNDSNKNYSNINNSIKDNQNKDISQPEKGFSTPLSYNNSNDNDIVRTFSSPALSKLPLKSTSTSVATRLPNNNYNRNLITPESISEQYTLNTLLFKPEKPEPYHSKSAISTGTRTTTTIISQPCSVDNSNVVVLPFSPITQKSASESSPTNTSPSLRSPSSSFLSHNNKAIVSPSLTTAIATNSSQQNSRILKYENSYSSTNKKKLVVKVHEGQGQCIVPELIPQTEEEKSVTPELGKMYVFIIRVNCQQKLYNPYVTVHLGNQQFSTCVSGVAEGLWNEGFMFDVSIHTQFFGILTFNLYNGNICLPDRFIGKCEIRIESLKNMPQMFDSWYELLDKNNKSPGAINIRIFYSYQDFHTMVKEESIEDLLMETEHYDITDKSTRSREVPREMSRMSTINEKEFEKFEKDIMSSLGNDSDSWYKSLRKVFISDDMFNVLKMIRRTLSTLGQGFNIGPTQLLEGILVLERYYQKREIPFEEAKKDERVILNLTLVEKTRDLFRYSLAAYGWIGLNYVGKGKGIIADSMKKDSSVATIVNFLCILKEDILLYNFQPSKVFDQVYFIAYDRRYDAVIFSIRGTWNVKDTLADLVCEYVKWNGGLVHSGVLSSAIYFYKQLFTKLKEIVRDKQPKNLYLTGHSLGAGIAAVLTIMLKNVEEEFEVPSGFKIECFCFAPPSVLDIELAKKYEHCIFSYVNNNDIVPRLSYGSLMDLHEMVCSVIENDKENEISIIKLLSNDTTKADQFIDKKLNEFEKCRNNLRTQTTFNTLNLKLCPPGKPYIILNNPKKQDDVILKETDLDELTEIKVKKSMFTDHSFKGYLENLNSLFKNTLLNRLNANMKITNSPRMMNEDYSSVTSGTSTGIPFAAIKEESESIIENIEKSNTSQNILEDLKDDNVIKELQKSNSALALEVINATSLNQSTISDRDTSLNLFKSIATVSTSNVNISISNDAELNKKISSHSLENKDEKS